MKTLRLRVKEPPAVRKKRRRRSTMKSLKVCYTLPTNTYSRFAFVQPWVKLSPHGLRQIGTYINYYLEEEDAPPVKKRKTGATTSAKAGKAEKDEDAENGEEEEEEEADAEEGADEDTAEASGPAATAKKVKGGVVPKEDDLKEVDEAVAADEGQDDE
jgi:hypothetical protein